MSEKLYKVLVGGKSCHNGQLECSLPKNGDPGEWHEVDGELQLCYRGLHLTDDPAQWWEPDCKVYLVEAEGVLGTCEEREDRKVVARRVRLIRELDSKELEELRIYTSGNHVAKARRHIAYDSASVRAFDSASVRAYNSASVEAFYSASVEAYDSASVEAFDSASVRAYNSASVRAFYSASVEAFDSASVEAFDSASVEAKDSVTVVTWWGKPGVKLLPKSRAVHVERGYGYTAPTVHVAEG